MNTKGRTTTATVDNTYTIVELPIELLTELRTHLPGCSCDSERCMTVLSSFFQ